MKNRKAIISIPVRQQKYQSINQGGKKRDGPLLLLHLMKILYFIAGGAGVTPFIAILRQLYKENKLEDNILFFSNRTSKDIILENEFNEMLGKNAVYTVTNEHDLNYLNEFINEDFLKKYVKDFSKHFYVCGPDAMVQDISNILLKLNVVPDAVIFER